MTAQRRRLLIAVEAEALFRRFEAFIANDPRAGQRLQAQHCLPEHLDSKLREYDTDAVIVIQPRFHDELIAAVRRWRTQRPDLQVLFCFRRLPNNRALVDLMRAGALDVLDMEIEAIREPLIQEVLSNLLRRLEEVHVGSFEREQVRNNLAEVGLIGESVEMQNLFMQLLHAARLSCPVLISGEAGSGKRLVAHAIHALGQRNGNQIVTVDCQSLSPALMRMALFGQASLAAGASSGYAQSNPGHGAMLMAAEHGTLLLHEISDIPYSLQAQMMELFEPGEPNGPSAPDVRFLSTTTRRMDRLVETRDFRGDLYNRLNVLPIEVPPLRRRLQDVPLLARYFVSCCEREGRSLALSDEAADALIRYSWPGNVRELRAAVEFAASRSADDAILPSHLPEAVISGGRVAHGDEPFSSSELNLARLERQAILRALQSSGFDKTKAARLLGIGKTTMYRKLKEIGK